LHLQNAVIIRSPRRVEVIDIGPTVATYIGLYMWQQYIDYYLNPSCYSL